MEKLYTAADIEQMRLDRQRMLAARGGRARAKKLSPERLREIALKASMAAKVKREAGRGKEGKAA